MNFDLTQHNIRLRSPVDASMGANGVTVAYRHTKWQSLPVMQVALGIINSRQTVEFRLQCGHASTLPLDYFPNSAVIALRGGQARLDCQQCRKEQAQARNLMRALAAATDADIQPESGLVFVKTMRPKRTHKKRRTQKKWLKRYGQVTDLFLGDDIYLHRESGRYYCHPCFGKISTRILCNRIQRGDYLAPDLEYTYHVRR